MPSDILSPLFSLPFLFYIFTPSFGWKKIIMKSAALAVCAVLGAGAMQFQTTLYSSYSFNPLEHLAGIAPYFEPADPPRDPNPPQGCSVTRAAYLVRHAAINANDFDYESYLEPFLQKVANATVDWSKIPQLSFLATWEAPSLVEQELLTRTCPSRIDIRS